LRATSAMSANAYPVRIHSGKYSWLVAALVSAPVMPMSEKRNTDVTPLVLSLVTIVGACCMVASGSALSASYSSAGRESLSLPPYLANSSVKLSMSIDVL
jgi:hypothetical protein